MTFMQPMPSTTASSGLFLTQGRSTPSQSTGRYGRSPSDFISSFYAVFRRWQSETAIYSDPDKITSHPCFSEMVQLAPWVLPLIIDELRTKPSLLVWVLDDAFADKPYSDNQVGDIPAMTNAWIAWAERYEF
jgi:hypothetical protein